MGREFDDCVRRRRIYRFERARGLVQKETGSAETDLRVAKASIGSGSYKWATIQAYYSMFHSARALIYSRGYRERSHYCLIIALRHLFVEEHLLKPKLVEILQLGKTLRESADYYGDFTGEAARQMVEAAEAFLKEAKRLVLKETEPA